MNGASTGLDHPFTGIVNRTHVLVKGEKGQETRGFVRLERLLNGGRNKLENLFYGHGSYTGSSQVPVTLCLRKAGRQQLTVDCWLLFVNCCPARIYSGAHAS